MRKCNEKCNYKFYSFHRQPCIEQDRDSVCHKGGCRRARYKNRSVLQFARLKRKQRRAFNDIVTGISLGGGNQRWFLQVVADGNQRRMLGAALSAGWYYSEPFVTRASRQPLSLLSLPRARPVVFFPPLPAAFLSFYSRESSQYADKELTTPAASKRNSRTD